MPKRGSKNKPARVQKKPPDKEASSAIVMPETILEAAAYSGPLPPPNALREYDLVLPGAAERIMVMAEIQSAHRQSLEKKAIGGDTWRSNLGLFAGFIVAVTGWAACAYFAYLGHPTQGAIVAGADLVALVGVFVYGTKSRKAERTQKVDSTQKSLRRR